LIPNFVAFNLVVFYPITTEFAEITLLYLEQEI